MAKLCLAQSWEAYPCTLVCRVILVHSQNSGPPHLHQLPGAPNLLAAPLKNSKYSCTVLFVKTSAHFECLWTMLPIYIYHWMPGRLISEACVCVFRSINVQMILRTKSWSSFSCLWFSSCQRLSADALIEHSEIPLQLISSLYYSLLLLLPRKQFLWLGELLSLSAGSLKNIMNRLPEIWRSGLLNLFQHISLSSFFRYRYTYCLLLSK